MPRQSNRIILRTPTGVCRSYTSWEALGRATGWSANSLRVMWHHTKLEDRPTGMTYNDHTIYRSPDNVDYNQKSGES